MPQEKPSAWRHVMRQTIHRAAGRLSLLHAAERPRREWTQPGTRSWDGPSKPSASYLPKNEDLFGLGSGRRAGGAREWHG